MTSVASGFLPGEGCGIVVLKRLKDALKDGNRIYSVIRGVGYSSDGRGGITAPSVSGQSLAVDRAYMVAGYPFGEVDGLETRLAESSPPGYAKGTMPCFAYPARDEIEIGGLKIAGSAQKRTGALFLQHGSIPLEKDEALLAAVSSPGESPEPLGMTSVSEALGRTVDFDAAVGPLVQGIADFFGVAFERFSLGPEDREAVRRIQASRYASDDWTFGKVPPAR